MESAAESAAYQSVASQAKRTARSAVSNGKRLHAVRPGPSVWARRFRDILAALVSDAGGEANMSEARMQLCRRAATLCVECEKLEIKSAGGPPSLEEAFKRATGGMKPIEILAEASRILHGLARIKGGNSLPEIAALPPQELDRVVDLLMKASDVAAKAAAFGEVDLEVYGALTDRLNRALRTLGLERIPREVGEIATPEYLRALQASPAPSLSSEDGADE
jgi:hypothetical protein